MVFSSANRFVAYNSAKKKLSYEKEYSKIEFINSEVEIPRDDDFKESFAVSAAVVEKVITTSIKLINNFLEGRIKKFVYQYTRRATNIQAGSYRVPKISFTNSIFLNGAYEESLKIELSPLHLRGTNSFIYELDRIVLNYSKALTSKWSNVFDYNIKLTLFFLEGNEVIKKELDPMVVQSVGFQENIFADQKIQTPIITFKKNACLTEVLLTIVESNPAKVNSESVLSLFQEHEDDIKDKVTGFLTDLIGRKT